MRGNLGSVQKPGMSGTVGSISPTLNQFSTTSHTPSLNLSHTPTLTLSQTRTAVRGGVRGGLGGGVRGVVKISSGRARNPTFTPTSTPTSDRNRRASEASPASFSRADLQRAG